MYVRHNTDNLNELNKLLEAKTRMARESFDAKDKECINLKKKINEMELELSISRAKKKNKKELQN